MSSVGTGLAIFFVLFFAGLIIWVVERRRNVGRAQETFADEHDLELESEWWKEAELSGTYDERPLEIVYKSSSNSSSTQYSVELPDSFPETFALQDEKLFWNRDQLTGADKIEVGHPEFDDRFIVEAKDAESTRAILGEDEVARPLLELEEETSTVQLADARLKIIDPGYPADPETLEQKTELLVAAADQLARAADERVA